VSYFEQKSSESAISRPHLVCVIQNLHLQLKSENGKQMSGTQMVEIILAQIDESNKSTSTFHNQFKDFFSSLDVKTLPFPVRLVDDLKRFNSLPDSERDPGYTPK
jgi:hypothetical protein